MKEKSIFRDCLLILDFLRKSLAYILIKEYDHALGTWADNIIIQAVADAMNLMIHITESNENFIEITACSGNSKCDTKSQVYLYRSHR